MEKHEYILTSDGELYHYGVLGMKWGVRRGNTGKAYAKASKKLQKLDNKVTKARDKAYAKREKADAKYDSMFSTAKGRAKADAKARKAQQEYIKRTRKAQKWLRSMEKTFKDTDISMSKEQADMGKRYMDTIDMHTQLATLR